MELLGHPLTIEEINNLRKTFGDYLKLTVDIEKECLVAGGELHADGEKLLLKEGSNQDNIWGGGINLKDKQIDAAAILNLRPRLENDNLEILDPQRRERFFSVVKRIFQKLWL